MNLVVRACAMAVVVGCLTSVAGCANSLLYNEARDKQAQAAKKAAEEVNLVAAVDAVQAKFRALAALEAETQRARHATSRELQIAELAAASPASAPASAGSVRTKYVAKLIEPRMRSLIGKVPTAESVQNVVSTSVPEREELQRQADSKLRVLQVAATVAVGDCRAAANLTTGKPFSATNLSPAAQEAIPPPRRAVALALLRDALAACERVDQAIGDPPDKGSVLHALRVAKQGDDAAVLEYKKEVQKHKQALAAAVAAAASSPAAKTAGERLKDGAAQLSGAVDGLREAATAVGSKAFADAHAQARLAALGKVLNALSSGTQDLSGLTQDEREAVLVVRLIPSVADEVSKWEREAERVRRAPLILAREHQRLVVAGFEAQLAVLERRARLRAQVLAAAEAEYVALATARLALDQGKVNLDESLANLIDKGEPIKRYHMFVSFAAYFDDAWQHRLNQELGELAIDAASTELAIEESRSAAGQWQSLGTNIAAVIGDFHAAGIKTRDIAELLKAFGLIHIGNNVGGQ